ncbi:MAG: sugar transferase [Armatimonadota bacterium]
MNTINKIIKRIIDVLLSLFSIIIFLPLILIIWVLIKTGSKGSVLFIQERVGKDKKPFNLYKFRTMVPGAEKKGLGFEVKEEDERITPTGKFLRRWCIDELPQLFNVLKGDMSIVGPRPTLRYQVDNYTARQIRRLEVKPGMTGLAQVSGRNILTWDEKINYDIEYIDNYSLWLDIKIMFLTFKLFAKPEWVYGKEKKE